MRIHSTISTAVTALFVMVFMLLPFGTKAANETKYTLSNKNISVTISGGGELLSFRNVHTGHDYQNGEGEYLWRMFIDTPAEKEVEITGSAIQQKSVSVKQVSATQVDITYDRLWVRGEQMALSLQLSCILEQDKVRFTCSMSNDVEHTVIREFQYPLLRNIQKTPDQVLFTSEAAGKIYRDPVASIIRHSMASPYKTPAQYFRQMDVKYGAKVSLNCIALLGDEQGLYLGSHDPLFQDTWHGLRVYPDAEGVFTRLEMGFYKYPHCFAGEKWENASYCLSPYKGDWHAAADIYRSWAASWWEKRPVPQWLKSLTGWQRVIFKHQYGEYLFRYSDLNGRIRNVGDNVGCNAVFTFGWWKEGMDHGNPDYTEDDEQGGDAAWKKAIEDYQEGGKRHIILYYNGKLIDRESKYYTSGQGPRVCRHDNTGSELHEHYKFTGMGTWLGEYDSRTFAVANMMNPEWNEVLFKLQDRAYSLGAHAVFYDQLGYIEKQSANWTMDKEYPVPHVYNILDRGKCLKLLRDRYAVKDPNFALGAEGLTDYLCQYCDYIHMYPLNSDPEHFMGFFRYCFPDVIFTDRGLRDDTDVERRVNLNLYTGQINDIEIYRCRDLIDKTPKYEAYLKKANELKNKYHDILLEGKYNDVFGFSLKEQLEQKAGVYNPDRYNQGKLSAHSFLSQDGRRMAVVVTNFNRECETVNAGISATGYRFVEAQTMGNATCSSDGKSIGVATDGLVVLIFEKK